MSNNENKFVMIGNEVCVIGDKVKIKNPDKDLMWDVYKTYKNNVFTIKEIHSDGYVIISNLFTRQYINIKELVKFKETIEMNKDSNIEGILINKNFNVRDTVMIKNDIKNPSKTLYLLPYKNKLCTIKKIFKNGEALISVNNAEIKVKLSYLRKIKSPYKPYKPSQNSIPPLNSSEIKYYVEKNKDNKYTGRLHDIVDRMEEAKVYTNNFIFINDKFIEISESELKLIKKDIIDKFKIFLDTVLLLEKYRYSNNMYNNLILSDLILYKNEIKKLLLNRMNIILDEPYNFSIKDNTLNLLTSFKLDIISDYIRKVIIY